MLEKDILDNAPKWATHFCKGDYYRESFSDDGNGGESESFEYYWPEKAGWYSDSLPHGARALIDIKTIVELIDALESTSRELHMTIEELNDHRMGKINCLTESPPDLLDMETLHINQVLIAKIKGES